MKRRIATEAEFDLEFLRDIKHRLRMTLREIEKAEKWLVKAAKFTKQRQKLDAEGVKAALAFYESLDFKTKEAP